METKHTPGTWMFEIQDTFNYVVFAAAQDGGNCKIIATVYSVGDRGKTGGESYHNARLIAAAPAMLKELQVCADMLREAGKDFALANPLAARPNLYELHEAQARAAIQAALGE